MTRTTLASIYAMPFQRDWSSISKITYAPAGIESLQRDDVISMDN
ncbi:MAG: hypothetical protein WBW04_22040 [Nitrolancea sp.]